MALCYSAFSTLTFSSAPRVRSRSTRKQNAYNLHIVRCLSDPSSPTEDSSTIITHPSVKRKEFPKDFLFGASTAAIQVEGSGTEGGRGPSTWDKLIRADEGGKGANSYYLYKDDVKLLKDMGVDAYRFSISWPRILPTGSTQLVNPEGIEYYNNLLDELEKYNIKPIVTLFHFDMPVALEEKYGGFMDRRIIDDFKAYCELCFSTFGHRVKHWIPINEGGTFVLYAPKLGVGSEAASKVQMSPYIQTHNLLLAYATAATLYKERFQAEQGGEIGMAVVCKWAEPHSDSDADEEAAKNSFDRSTGWYLSPLCTGDYPDALKSFVPGLPKFSEAEKQLLKRSWDFIGVNYYITNYAKASTVSIADFDLGHTRLDSITESFSRNGEYIGPYTLGTYPMYVNPPGLTKVLLHIKDKYKNPKMYITENGVCTRPNITASVKDAKAMGIKSEIDDELHDSFRIEALRNNLHAVHEALKHKANVNGYFAWTLMDNMEFGVYDVRWGLNYVDYLDNFKRYPKDSARWYRDFLGGKI